MKFKSLIEWLIVAISVVTVISGLTQMLLPRFVLSIIGGQETPTSLQLFGTIGMFMLLFGGALLHSIFSAPQQRVVILWAGLQKVGAVCAVAVGVAHHLFSTLALAVAGFDLLSAGIILYYWNTREP